MKWAERLPDESIETQRRKIEHIDIILNKDTQYRKKTTLLECVGVIPNGGSLEASDVDLGTALLDREISAPLFISGMTGGPEATFDINKALALAAAKAKIPMGVGSQRAMIENSKLTFSYDMKKIAGDMILIGNLGASKLLKYGNSTVQKAIDAINADMLALHTNPGQESVQPEGNIDFRGVYERICEVAESATRPVLLKEVGNGISKEVAAKVNGKVFGIDVQGAGGTTWIGVETYRSKGSYGKAFWDWGIPTALSVMECKSAFNGPVWASGGLRVPSDMVRALALGADMCGMARPFLVSENKGGSGGVYSLLISTMYGMKEEMARLGFSSVAELKKAKVRISEPLSDLMRQRGIRANATAN